MSTENTSAAADRCPHELAAKRSEWWWFLLLGIALIVFGAGAISVPFFATVLTVKILGVLLLIAGIAQVVSAFWEGQWSGFFMHLLMGILYAVVGGLIVRNPGEGMVLATAMLAALLIVGGLFRAIVAMKLQFHMWGWVLLGGLISLFLGILIWAELPASSLYIIGLFVGIEMIFNGWAWVMLGFDLRSGLAEES